MNKLIGSLAVIGVLGYGASRLWSGGDESTEPSLSDGGGVVLDRVWVDHLPRNERETVQVFVAISEEPVGVFQNASMWRGQYEAFRYEARGSGELAIKYPQTGERESVRTRSGRCNEAGMDYCLELEGASRGVKRYYSRKGWEIRATKLADVQQHVDSVLTSIQ